MMRGSFILDACAVIALLNAEEGGEKVKTLLENTENEIYMHLINLCEIYYGFYKKDGEKRADIVIEGISLLPVEYINDLSINFLKTVGRYKATHRISLADAFVLGLAEKMRGLIVTTDHNEFDPIDHKRLIKFYWLR